MRKLLALAVFLALTTAVSAASITIDAKAFDSAEPSKSAKQLTGFVEIPEDQISIAAFLLDASGNSLNVKAAEAFDGAKGKYAKVTVNVDNPDAKLKLKLQGGAEYESVVDLKFGTGEGTETAPAGTKPGAVKSITLSTGSDSVSEGTPFNFIITYDKAILDAMCKENAASKCKGRIKLQRLVQGRLESSYALYTDFKGKYLTKSNSKDYVFISSGIPDSGTYKVKVEVGPSLEKIEGVLEKEFTVESSNDFNNQKIYEQEGPIGQGYTGNSKIDGKRAWGGEMLLGRGKEYKFNDGAGVLGGYRVTALLTAVRAYDDSAYLEFWATNTNGAKTKFDCTRSVVDSMNILPGNTEICRKDNLYMVVKYKKLMRTDGNTEFINGYALNFERVHQKALIDVEMWFVKD